MKRKRFSVEQITSNYASIALKQAVTPAMMAIAIGVALIIGLIGGLFPAIRAARLPPRYKCDERRSPVRVAERKLQAWICADYLVVNRAH